MKFRIPIFALVSIFMLAMGWAGIASAQNIEVVCDVGVYDIAGDPLVGRTGTTSGDLVQLIWAGPDSLIDPPYLAGGTTGDDEVVDSTQIGNGYPIIFGDANGRFTKTFQGSQLSTGNWFYIRAWDDSIVVAGQTMYGHSTIFQKTDDQFQQVTIDSFATTEDYVVPVELNAFSAAGLPGKIILSWATQSETENLGFHIERRDESVRSFQQITKSLIKGAGNSSTENQYEYADRDVTPGKTYYYRLVDIDYKGNRVYHGPVNAVALQAPKSYALQQNYPNPFNPTTTINYQLKEDGHVSLKVYNMRGQLVIDLVNENKGAGEYRVIWNGKDAVGKKMASGVYFYRLKVNDYESMRKMVLTK